MALVRNWSTVTFFIFSINLIFFGSKIEILYYLANQKLDTFCGSPPYAAPELFSDDHYIGRPVDIWALGILLYFMVVGNMPFRAPSLSGLKAAILNGDYFLPGQLSLPCSRLIRKYLIFSLLYFYVTTNKILFN